MTPSPLESNRYPRDMRLPDIREIQSGQVTVEELLPHYKDIFQRCWETRDVEGMRKGIDSLKGAIKLTQEAPSVSEVAGQIFGRTDVTHAQVLLSNVEGIVKWYEMDEALAHKNYAALEDLLKENAPINLWDKNGKTLLEQAIQSKDEQAILLLRKYGARVNPRSLKLAADLDEETFIRVLGSKQLFDYTQTLKTARKAYESFNYCYAVACRGGFTEIVKELIELGLGVNVKHYSPLMIAVRENRPEVVKLLLDNGAHVEHPDSDDQNKTALYFAVESQSHEIIELLLSKGAKTNKWIFETYLSTGTDPEIAKRLVPSKKELVTIPPPTIIKYSTFLIQEILKKYPELEKSLKECINRGIDSRGYPDYEYDYINSEQIEHKLSYIAKAFDLGWKDISIKILDNRKFYSVFRTPENLKKYLKEDPLLIDYVGKLPDDSMNCLEAACLEGNVEVVKNLLALGMTPTHKSFLEASKHKTSSKEMIQLLVERGYDSHKQDNLGNTALHQAIIDKDVKAISRLMQQKANASIFNLERKQPLELVKKDKVLFEALAGKNDKLFDFIQNRSGATFLTAACERGDLDIIKSLLTLGFDPNKQYGHDEPPIFFANRKEVIDVLLEAGVGINVKSDGWSLLEKAILDKPTLIEHLLDKGAKTTSTAFLRYVSKQNATVKLAARLIPSQSNLDPNLYAANAIAAMVCLQKYPALEKQIKVIFYNQPERISEKIFDYDKETFESVLSFILKLEVLTPVTYLAAIRSNSEELVELHRSHGFGINSTDKGGNSVVHLVAQMGTIPELKQLIADGANITAKNRRNETPLTLACQKENADKIAIILEALPDSSSIDLGALIKQKKALSIILPAIGTKFPELKEDIEKKLMASKPSREVLLAAIQLDLGNVIQKCLLSNINFLAEDQTGRSALDAMLAYGTDVVEVLKTLPLETRIEATSELPRIKEDQINKVPTSDLAIALTVPEHRARLLGFASLEFINGNLMKFFAKFSMQEMNFEERYQTLKTLSPIQQREYLKLLPSEEQEALKARFVNDHPTLTAEVQEFNTKVYIPTQNRLGESAAMTFKDPETALTTLKNKDETIWNCLNALEYLAQHMTNSTFPKEHSLEIQAALSIFNQRVVAFDSELINLGNSIKKLPLWKDDAQGLQDGYLAMMKIQDETIKPSFVKNFRILSASTSPEVKAVSKEFNQKVVALEQAIDDETFKKLYLEIISDPEYIIYLKNWEPKKHQTIYANNFEALPGLIADLVNASKEPLQKDDRLDYDILYKLVYALPRFDLQKQILGTNCGEYLMVLSEKLE